MSLGRSMAPSADPIQAAWQRLGTINSPQASRAATPARLRAAQGLARDRVHGFTEEGEAGSGVVLGKFLGRVDQILVILNPTG